MNRLLFCATLLVVFTVPLTHAETVEEMLSACRPMTDAPVSDGTVHLPATYNAGLCWGAFAMVQRVITIAGDVETPIRLFGVCAPATSTRTQLIAIFVEYAKSNPQRYSEDFADVVFVALRQAFPCSASPPKKQ
jgi:hypothetical protein